MELLALGLYAFQASALGAACSSCAPVHFALASVFGFRHHATHVTLSPDTLFHVQTAKLEVLVAGLGERGKPAEIIAQETAQQLVEDVHAGGCMDRW